MTPRSIALIAVTDHGLELARVLRGRLKSGDVFRPERYGQAPSGWEHTLPGPLAAEVPGLFAGFDQLVFFLATGAVTRLIAPCLVSKTSDPGVLAVDEAGRFVVPVLSGHAGGANTFARTVAGCLGAVAVITTASDVIGGLSPDVLQQEHGWVPEPSSRLKDAALALVNKLPVAVAQEIGRRGAWLEERELPPNVTVVRAAAAVSRDAPAERDLPPASVWWITDRLVRDLRGFEPDRILWYRPRSLVLGVGCERGISTEALEQGLEQFLNAAGYARASIGLLATVQVKTDEAGLLEWARQNGWEIAFYTAEELSQVSEIPNPSPTVARCVGTPGVAEPAALKASGAERLLVEKQVVASPLSPRRMTFALARSAEFEEAAPGKVIFVGAGPGDPDLLTVKARQALARAEVVVYAGSLIPEAILRAAPGTAALHNSAHLTLEETTKIVAAAARAGRRVVRLQSGDTTIYSAIQEQMSLLDEAGISYDVIPGISSFQAAAAALKTELTLPEVAQTIILTRGEGETRMPDGEALTDLARHGATLCIFLSARLAEKVQEQLLGPYPPDTPTAIAYRVGWPEEKIIVTDLASLAQTIRTHKLTRTTLILVGKAVGGRQNRSRLYNASHGHIFRRRRREEESPAPERHP